MTFALFSGAYTTHQMVVRMALTSYDQIPEKLAEYCFVEYTMPQTTVSHSTIRSVSVQDSDSDDPPEKYVRYLARYEYKYDGMHFINSFLSIFSLIFVSSNSLKTFAQMHGLTFY